MLRDVALRLLRDRYRALSTLREAHDDADWFEARMFGRRALVVRGQEGTRLFYDPSLVTRRGAVPAPLRLLLFGPGAVHGLNGERHAARKAIHLGVVDRAAVERLCAEVARRLRDAARSWPERDHVRLFDELVEVYGAAVLDWGGTETPEPRAREISRELAAIVDGFGIAGTTYARAWLGRVRTTWWARNLVREVRRGERHPDPGTPLARMAATDLPDTVAAVELLNVLRPTVAVAYFGAWAAHALHHHPEWRERLAGGSTEDLKAFEHEVRRWYPFTPLLTGRTVTDHQWQGHDLPRKSWVVLDVLGTNRDERSWSDPDAFAPERFVGREPNQFEFVTHGGGDPAEGHRCPGEPLAVGILETTLELLAQLDYDLAESEPAVELHRIPSLPENHVELRRIRWATTPASGR